jgi:hypothetical protein
MNDLIKFLTVIAIVIGSVAAALAMTFYGSHGTLPGMTP